MPKYDLNAALDNVELAYNEIIDIANDSVAELTGDLDDLINRVYNNIERLTNDDIRDTLLRLSLRAFSFSAIKDKAAFKATLAESLRKEAYAKSYSTLGGTISSRDAQATLSISNEIVVEHLYNLTAALFKTKLDQVHRCVDTLKTVLMSRLSEAKLCNIEG
jgi:hypothetical protein